MSSDSVNQTMALGVKVGDRIRITSKTRLWFGKVGTVVRFEIPNRYGVCPIAELDHGRETILFPGDFEVLRSGGFGEGSGGRVTTATIPKATIIDFTVECDACLHAEITLRSRSYGLESFRNEARKQGWMPFSSMLFLCPECTNKFWGWVGERREQTRAQRNLRK